MNRVKTVRVLWRRALVVLVAALGSLLVTAGPALAARGHVFEASFGSEGSGTGQFKEPDGVAVNEATGQIYVVDKGNNRVEYFGASGAYEGQFTGPSATGTGDLAEGSSTIEALTTASGAFTVGEEISAAGLPAGTTITKVNSSTVLEVSAEATASETGASLSAHQSFSTPEYVAVDNSCHLQGLVGSACTSADPSNEDVYVVDAGHSAIDKFNASGTYIGQLTEGEPGVPLSGVSGIAVDEDGQLWVAYTGGDLFDQNIANFTNGRENAFVETREPSAGRASLEPGFGVDGDDNLYVHSGFGGYNSFNELRKFNVKGEALGEPFEIEMPVSALAVEADNPRTPEGSVYVDNVESIARFDLQGRLLERFGEGTLEAAEYNDIESLLNGQAGVAVDAESGHVYVTEPVNGVVDIFGPEPPGKPTVRSESTLAVDSSSATLQAEVNPRGAATEYRFEYGKCDSAASCAVSGYEASIPVTAETVGSDMDFSIYTLEEQLRGLAPDTVYHYRIVATNTYGNVTGAAGIFTTQPSGAPLQLLDGRGWELVSPPNKYGARLDGLEGRGVFESSLDGRALTYVANRPTEPEPAGYSSGVQILSRRGSEGWSSKDIAPRRSVATGFETEPQYQFFSEDLSRSLLYPQSATPLSTEVSDPTPYLRDQARCEAEGEGPETECYLPLATTKEPLADVPAGSEFGGSYQERLQFEGATPDMRHIYLQSPVALTETPIISRNALYEWSAERPQKEALQLISVLPEDEGGEPTFGSIGGNLNDRWSASRNSISADGSRVFWQTGTTLGGTRALYMRDTVKGETIRLDVPQPGAAGGSPTPWFQFASRDGSRVFFSDSERLTEGSGTGNTDGRGDLYECRIVEEAGKDACELADLTPETPSGESAEVENILPGAAENGSYVYFVANGVLAEGATPGDCEGFGSASTASCNLYVYHEGRTTFIATLSIIDEYDWGGVEDLFHNLGRLTAEASPDGRYLAFMSIEKLTGYDNRALASGKPAMEVYLYDAAANHLSCISCDPTGARPTALTVGEFTGIDTSRANLAAVMGGSNEVYGNETLIAANLPHGDVLDTYGESLYQPRFVMDSGRVFFNAVSALSPQDINGDVDAYEYEPAGAGSCVTSAPSYSWLDNGCVDLLSPGTAAGESAFLEASEGGGNVFFLTGEQLVRGDTDTATDIYDARICTASEPCPGEAASPPPCTSASACRKAPASQPSLFGAPATATFSGQGNVTPAKVKPKKLTRKQRLKRALKRCDVRFRHSKHKQRRCKRRARKRLRLHERRHRHHRHAHAGRRHRRTGRRHQRTASGRRGR